MAKILITARSVAANKECKVLLEAAGHQLLLHAGTAPWTEAEMIQNIVGVDAAIVGLDEITAKVLEAGRSSLKIIARNGVGYNNVDTKAAARLNIPVTLTPGTNTLSVCELVFGLMLAVARHIPVQNSEVHSGGWQRLMGCELHGKVLGVLGTGNIGSEVIKRAQAFGMKIIAFDVVQKSELIENYAVKYLEQDEVFKQADFLTLHVPSLPSTKDLVNAHTLGLMKDSAILINTARGDLIHEHDLYSALKSGKIAAYGADTLQQEPPAADHPLLSLPNVIITPHAGAYTRESVIRCSVTAAQEVIRVLAGQKPFFAVK